jgi:hypothetical protein
MTDRWKYLVSVYYGEDHPKAPGQLAIEVGLADEWSAAIEVKAARSREDIGEVVVVPPLTGRALEWSLQP